MGTEQDQKKDMGSSVRKLAAKSDLNDDKTKYVTSENGMKKYNCLGDPTTLSEDEKKRGEELRKVMTDRSWAEQQVLVYFETPTRLRCLKNALNKDLEKFPGDTVKTTMLVELPSIIKKLLEENLLKKATKKYIDIHRYG
jgi:hypothetical protein